MNEIKMGDYVMIKDGKFDGMLFEILKIYYDYAIVRPINSLDSFPMKIKKLQLATNVHGETLYFKSIGGLK